MAVRAILVVAGVSDLLPLCYLLDVLLRYLILEVFFGVVLNMDDNLGITSNALQIRPNKKLSHFVLNQGITRVRYIVVGSVEKIL